MPGHRLAAEVEVSQELIVDATQQADVVGVVTAAVAVGVPVVELESVPRGAAPALLVHVAAPAPVPLVHGSLDRGGDVARS